MRINVLVLFVEDQRNFFCIDEEKNPFFYNNRYNVKEAVSRDFRPLFFSRIEPTWAPDKQAKMVLL